MDSASRSAAGDSAAVVAGWTASERMMDGEDLSAARRSGEGYRSPRTFAFAGDVVVIPGEPDDGDAGVKDPSNDAVCWRNGERETYPPSARPVRPVEPLAAGFVGLREGEAPLDVRRSSVRDGLRGVEPALTVFLVPDTLRVPVDDAFRAWEDALPVDTLRPWLIRGLDPDDPSEGEPDLKIELLTRLLCRTCLKLELVRLGPSSPVVVVRAGDPAPDAEGGARTDDGRFVFNGAHPFVEVEMMLARSLSSNRRAVEGDETGERTLLMCWCA